MQGERRKFLVVQRILPAALAIYENHFIPNRSSFP